MGGGEVSAREILNQHGDGTTFHRSRRDKTYL